MSGVFGSSSFSFLNMDERKLSVRDFDCRRGEEPGLAFVPCIVL